MNIHHIGYLVKKIDRAIAAFENLGYSLEKDTVFDEYRGVDICFVSKDGYRVELVSPQNKESIVFNLQKKYGNSPYHICYLCESIGAEVEKLENQGYIRIDEPHVAVAISNRKVCFLIHPYLGMIELLEE